MQIQTRSVRGQGKTEEQAADSCHLPVKYGFYFIGVTPWSEKQAEAEQWTQEAAAHVPWAYWIFFFNSFSFN